MTMQIDTAASEAAANSYLDGSITAGNSALIFFEEGGKHGAIYGSWGIGSFDTLQKTSMAMADHLLDQIVANADTNIQFLSDSNVKLTITKADLVSVLGSAITGGGGGDVNVQADWNETDNASDHFILNKPTLDFEPTQAGKHLSANDFTTLLLNKLNAIAAGAEVNVKADWAAASGAANEVLNKPSLNFEPTQTGKSLSEKDFTAASETKLNNIAANAEVNVQSDWDATTGDAKILNKPTFSTAPNDAQKNVKADWNAGVGAANEIENKPSLDFQPIEAGKGLSTEDLSTAAKDFIDKLLTTGRNTLQVNNAGLISENGTALSAAHVKAIRESLSLFHETMGFDGTNIFLAGHVALSDSQKTAMRSALNVINSVQADWNETDSTNPAFINNKPALGGGGSVQADWNETDNTSDAFIANKPAIPTIPDTPVQYIENLGDLEIEVNKLTDTTALPVKQYHIESYVNEWHKVDKNLKVRVSKNREQLQFKYTNGNGYPDTVEMLQDFVIRSHGKNNRVLKRYFAIKDQAKGWSFGGTWANNYEMDANNPINGRIEVKDTSTGNIKLYTFSGQRFKHDKERKANNGFWFGFNFETSGKSLSTTGVNK